MFVDYSLFSPLLMLRLMACEADEDGAEHGEHHRLDEADKHLEGGHEHTHNDAHGTHAEEDAQCFGGDEEDDAHQRDGDSVSCHDIGKETDHECEGLGEDAYELYRRDEREGLERHRHIGPEDIFPIMLVAAELHDDKGAEGEEEGHGDVAGDIAAARRERDESHDVAGEDEEETSEQVGTVFLISLADARFDDVIHHIHHQHLNEAGEAAGCLVARLVAPVPPGGKEDAEQQYNDADEHRRHRLGDRDVERPFLLAVHQFHNLPLVVALCGDDEVVGSLPVAVGIGMMLECRTAIHMPSRGAMDDDGEMDDDGFAADVGDMPLIGILDMLQHDVRDIQFRLLPLCSHGGHSHPQQPCEAKQLSDVFHFVLMFKYYRDDNHRQVESEYKRREMHGVLP